MSESVRNRPVENPPPQNEPTARELASLEPERPLSPRQLEAINLLFAGRSFGEVSTELGVAARTLYRWRQSAAFTAEVRQRYRQGAVARRPRDRTLALIPSATPLAVEEQVIEPKNSREATEEELAWKKQHSDWLNRLAAKNRQR